MSRLLPVDNSSVEFSYCLLEVKVMITCSVLPKHFEKKHFKSVYVLRKFIFLSKVEVRFHVPLGSNNKTCLLSFQADLSRRLKLDSIYNYRALTTM